jgi:hypothetical protein
MTQKREQVQKSKSTAKREAVLEEAAQAKKDEEAEALKDASDELLDEIDALLEDQEVLVNYRQKGGQ